MHSIANEQHDKTKASVIVSYRVSSSDTPLALVTLCLDLWINTVKGTNGRMDKHEDTSSIITTTMRTIALYSFVFYK